MISQLYSHLKPGPDLHVDWFVVAALKKINPPANWMACYFEETQAGIEVLGGIPQPAGNGKLTWDESALIGGEVTSAEAQNAKLAYEVDTGKCSECLGDGWQWIMKDPLLGVHFQPYPQVGGRFRRCKRCCATGKASRVKK